MKNSRPESLSRVLKWRLMRLEHLPQYRSLIGDSLLEDEADMGAEVAFLWQLFIGIKFSCSYSMQVRLSLVERPVAIGGTLVDLMGRPALALRNIEAKELLEVLPDPVAIIINGPSDIDELEEVVEEEDSFLTLLLEHVVPTSGLVVGVDSAEGEVGGGEQGCTIISGKFKVNFCLILCELLLGLLLKGELGTEDSVSCLIDNTVLSDSVEDWTSKLIGNDGTLTIMSQFGDLSLSVSSSSSAMSLSSTKSSTAESWASLIDSGIHCSSVVSLSVR